MRAATGTTWWWAVLWLSPLGIPWLGARLLLWAHASVWRPRGARSSTRWSGANVSLLVTVLAIAGSCCATLLGLAIARGVECDLERLLHARIPDVLVDGPRPPRLEGEVRRRAPVLGRVLLEGHVVTVEWFALEPPLVPRVTPALLGNREVLREHGLTAGEHHAVVFDPLVGSALEVEIVELSRDVAPFFLVLETESPPRVARDVTALWFDSKRTCADLALSTDCTDRQTLEHEARAMFDLGQILRRIFFGVLLLLCGGLGLVSMRALCLERRVQLATLRAMGLSSRETLRLLWGVATRLTLRAVLAGMLAAAGWMAFLNALEVELDPEAFVIEVLHVQPSWVDLGVVFTSFWLALSAGIVRPMLHALKTPPSSALTEA